MSAQLARCYLTPNRFIGLALLVSLVAAPAPRAQTPQTIEVNVPTNVDAARNRVVSVLVGQGVVVIAAQGPVVQTAPYRFNPATAVIVTVNLVAQDSATRVVFSGTYSIPSLGVHDEPMTGAKSRLQGQLWAWLKAMAAKVQADSSGSASYPHSGAHVSRSRLGR